MLWLPYGKIIKTGTEECFHRNITYFYVMLRCLYSKVSTRSCCDKPSVLKNSWRDTCSNLDHSDVNTPLCLPEIKKITFTEKTIEGRKGSEFHINFILFICVQSLSTPDFFFINTSWLLDEILIFMTFFPKAL